MGRRAPPPLRSTSYSIIFSLGNSFIFPITLFPCPFSVLAIALFIHYTSVPRSKINKQGCGLARKGHGNGINEIKAVYTCSGRLLEWWKKGKNYQEFISLLELLLIRLTISLPLCAWLTWINKNRKTLITSIRKDYIQFWMWIDGYM